MTDLQLCDLCATLYSGGTGMQVFCGPEANGRAFAIAETPEARVIVCEGSHNPGDWMADFTFQYFDSPDIGGVERGFYQGPAKAIEVLMPFLKPDKPLYVTGHSLGASEGVNLAAMLAVRKVPIAGVTVFACPQPGGPQLDEILGAANVPVRLYLNHFDIVCRVPVKTLIPHWPYTHPARIINIDERPTSLIDSYGPLAWHHLALYRQGVAKVATKQ